MITEFTLYLEAMAILFGKLVFVGLGVVLVLYIIGIMEENGKN